MENQNIQHHRRKVLKTAHIFTFGHLSSKTKYIWITCHGYAQRAEDFIQSFIFLDPETHFVIAPEGLSRFYRKGFNGEVASSWMTREDRMDEINDYTRYLQGVYEEYTSELDNHVKIVLFGFSQGVATVFRWMHLRSPYYDYLLCWAGSIPEDLSYEHSLNYINSKKNFYFYGLYDPLLPEDGIDSLRKLIEKEGLDIKFHHFDGKHEIEEEPLKAFVEKYLKG
jgi:predicted esterase